MRIAVIGAAGELGRRIVRALIKYEGVQVLATSRQADKLTQLAGGQVECAALDLEAPDAAARVLDACDIVVFCPILTLSLPTAQALRALGNKARFVFFSSNNVGLDETAEIYEALRECEAAVDALSGANAIIRPTMIYGTPDDGNLGRLLKAARRFPVMPIMGKGTAKQQPIHYQDLAELAAQLATDLSWQKLRVGAAGASICSLRELYEQVVTVSTSNALIVHLPLGLMKLCVGILEAMRLPFPIKTAQLNRVEIDKLPTWPLPEGWYAKIGLAEGLSKIVQQMETRDNQ